ncbi:MAG: hypothetical protein ACRECO_02675 [Xanthobacteraceae bacterium]
MGTVMIRCPDTGREIPTGMVADRKSFNSTPVFFARVFCPVCRTEHEWFAKEAWVCEAESSAARQRIMAQQDASTE